MTNYSGTLDAIFHALSDPTRRSIVQSLLSGPRSVSELARPVAMALPTILQHLKVLEDCGLISSRKAGRIRTCEIRTKQLEIAEVWIAQQRATWEDSLNLLDAYLESAQLSNSENKSDE